ncbi:uncharacterized protein BKA55DRAFT_100538 [Fusarium redolens]|uniref:Uncharacterized protein n=1 Tax=Fusarium redolens TaxID=48865 RepID=A0A9P9GQG5_FUSRE|nr:uncharacterized protein BKA55DRAFT_100538 [Fusarium redolens]KAH7243625.1 hypothetical protein BKA55DRAFT_100538 [Fusarium redolens]
MGAPAEYNKFNPSEVDKFKSPPKRDNTGNDKGESSDNNGNSEKKDDTQSGFVENKEDGGVKLVEDSEDNEDGGAKL